jgi:hypothetical protein
MQIDTTQFKPFIKKKKQHQCKQYLFILRITMSYNQQFFGKPWL